MTVGLFLLCVAAWWLGGSAIFAYWWVKDDDLKYSDMAVVIMLGLVLGPFIGFLAGWFIHVDLNPKRPEPKILIKKRR